MFMKETHFDQQSIERFGMGGGVLPTSLDPETKEPLFLLGRERWSSLWRGSLNWSGFEGSRRKAETNLEASLREFTEETLGVVIEKEKIQRMIHDGEHLFRVVLRVVSESKIPRFHTTYVVSIKYDENIPSLFMEKRLHIEYVDRLVQEWKQTRSQWLMETSENPEEEEDYIGKLVDCGTYIQTQRSLLNVPSFLKHPWKRSVEDEHLFNASFSNQLDVLMGRKYFELRRKIERAVQTSHDCMTIVRDKRWNEIQNVVFNSDYLEKDQVRWWKKEELERVLEDRGVYSTDKFRPYFLPVLQIALSKMIDPSQPVCPSERNSFL
jgi:hypothetical protein